jgi:hypothetical protein
VLDPRQPQTSEQHTSKYKRQQQRDKVEYLFFTRIGTFDVKSCSAFEWVLLLVGKSVILEDCVYHIVSLPTPFVCVALTGKYAFAKRKGMDLVRLCDVNGVGANCFAATWIEEQ